MTMLKPDEQRLVDCVRDGLLQLYAIKTLENPRNLTITQTAKLDRAISDLESAELTLRDKGWL